MAQHSEQLQLGVPIRQVGEIGWLHFREVVLLQLFGRKLITKYVQAGPELSFGSIKAEDIGDLNDPDLRYALRLADATNSVNQEPIDGCKCSKYNVYINATDEGADSRLVSVEYTGRVDGGRDEFKENLLRAAPPFYEDH